MSTTTPEATGHNLLPDVPMPELMRSALTPKTVKWVINHSDPVELSHDLGNRFTDDTDRAFGSVMGDFLLRHHTVKDVDDLVDYLDVRDAFKRRYVMPREKAMALIDPVEGIYSAFRQKLIENPDSLEELEAITDRLGRLRDVAFARAELLESLDEPLTTDTTPAMYYELYMRRLTQQATAEVPEKTPEDIANDTLLELFKPKEFVESKAQLEAHLISKLELTSDHLGNPIAFDVLNGDRIAAVRDYYKAVPYELPEPQNGKQVQLRFSRPIKSSLVHILASMKDTDSNALNVYNYLQSQAEGVSRSKSNRPRENKDRLLQDVNNISLGSLIDVANRFIPALNKADGKARQLLARNAGDMQFVNAMNVICEGLSMSLQNGPEFYRRPYKLAGLECMRLLLGRYEEYIVALYESQTNSENEVASPAVSRLGSTRTERYDLRRPGYGKLS